MFRNFVGGVSDYHNNGRESKGCFLQVGIKDAINSAQCGKINTMKNFSFSRTFECPL